MFNGNFTLRFTNIETGEVRTVDSKNTWSFDAEAFMLNTNTNMTVLNHETYYTQVDNNEAKIIILHTPVIGGLKTANYLSGLSFTHSSSQQQGWITSGSQPIIRTREDRWQPPAAGTTRTIYGLCIAHSTHPVHSGPHRGSLAYTMLSTPCIQTDTEVLDVFYRLEISTHSSPIASAAMQYVNGFNLGESVARLWTGGTGRYTSKIAAVNGGWFKMPLDATKFDNFYFRADDDTHLMYGSRYGTTPTETRTPFIRRSYSGTLATNDDIGRLIRTSLFSNTSLDSNGGYEKVQMFSPAFGNTFLNKPVHPIHNHSGDAKYPFIDVDYLATGYGTINAQPGTWTDTTGMLEYWRADIKNTGQVGTSRYFVRKNIRGEFSGNTYFHGYGNQNQIPALFSDGQVLNGTTGSRTARDAHLSTNNQSMQAWIDNRRLIGHNDSGLTIYDITTNDYVNLDGLTLAGFTVSKIHQVSVAADGTLYVACANFGLYKITDPAGSPVCTKLTVVDVSINSNKCYGVCEGYADSLWAIFDGGIAHSINAGSSWTTYTVANGNWKHRPAAAVPLEEIGATNWNTFRMVVADITKPGHELGFLRHSVAYEANRAAEVVWWSPGRDAVDFKLNAPNNSTFVGLLNTNGGVARTGFFRCSRTDSFWAIRTWINDIRNTPNATYVLKHYLSAAYKMVPWSNTGGTSTSDNMYGYVFSYNANRAASIAGILGFQYDHYGKSYGNWGRRGNSYYGTGESCYAYDKFLTEAFATTQTNGSPASGGCNVSFERYNLATGPSPHVVSNWYGATLLNSHLSTYTGADENSQSALFPANDPLNGKVYATKDFSWIDYRWTGSAWQKDYHAPLVDSTANAHAAARHLFDIESHTFTGRSSVDLSSVLSENFNTGLTAVGTFNFEPKPLKHLISHTFYSTDKFTVFRTMDDSGISVKVYDAGDGRSFPYTFAQETDNRVVVSVSSVPNDSYNFKWARSNEFTQGGSYFQCYEDKFEGYSLPNASSVMSWNTYYSPVYDAIQNNDVSMKFKINVPTVTGPGAGVRFAIRFGDYKFTESLDTYYSTTGTLDYSGARPRDGVWVNFPGGTTAPTSAYFGTAIPYVQTAAVVADDQNGINRLELRFKIVAGTLTITVYRIAVAGTPITPVALGTFTRTGPETTGNKKGIFMITPQYSAYGVANSHQLTEFELYDYSVGATFGKTAYTSTVKVSVNGTEVLAQKYASEIPLNTASALWLGTEFYSKDRMFVGTVSNPQIWNVAWNADDVTADMVNITSTINTANAPATAMKARYNMSQALVETKATHVTADTLPGGHTIQFGNGTSNGETIFAFYDSDYYTFGMYDGLLKDNAISLNVSQEMYVRPHDFNYNELESPNVLGMQSNIVAATTAVTVEPVQFRETSAIRKLGEIVGRSTTDPQNRAVSVQRIVGDGYVEANITMREVPYIGLQVAATNGYTFGGYFQFALNGSYTVRVNATVIYTAPLDSYAAGDKFKVERVNTSTTPTFNFYQNDILVATSSTSATALPLYGMFGAMNFSPSGFANVKMSYLREWPSLDIGNYTTNKGKFDPSFITFVDDRLALWSVMLNGVEATKILIGDKTGSTIGNYSLIPASIPAGTVYIIPDTGVLFFSASDIGKIVTLKAPLLTY